MKRSRMLIFSILFIFLFSLPVLAAEEAEPERSEASYTEEEQQFIARHPKLRVGYVTDRIPVIFESEQNGASGISRYVFDRISEISHMEFEYVPLRLKDVTYTYLMQENLDLVTSVEYNEENKKANGILITEPYFSSRKVVVTRKSFDFDINGHYSVAISTGSQTLKQVLARTFPNFELTDYDTISDCFDAVNRGEADLLIQNQFVVEYWLAKPKYEQLKVIPIMGLDDRHCFSAVVAMNGGEGTSPEEGKVLVNILDKAISVMNEDEIGSYTIQGVMENQYRFTVADFLYRYRVTVFIFIIAVLIILILLVILTRQRLRYAESRAEARAKGRFLSTMSHEIRTPLNGLIGLYHLMRQKINDPAKMEEYLLQASETAKYLLSLINDILDSSKLEAEKLELQILPVDLQLMLQTVSAIERNSLSEKMLNFETEVSLPFPCVSGDEVRIQQVLLNLLDNARKFTQKGGRITLSVEQEKKEHHKILTTFRVADTGKGMSEEFQKHIFDLFSQELDTVSKGNQGTGLGLSISRRLARLMGGDLTCHSKKGEGSVFTFTFLSEPAEMPQQSGEPVDLAHSVKPRVLVAEDNELNGEILLELLREKGFEAELVTNGKKAVERFAGSKPGYFGVILMDLLMPEMNGFEAAARIRAMTRPDAKTVRILACTANTLNDEREKAKQAGMDDFITKPLDVDKLFEKLLS